MIGFDVLSVPQVRSLRLSRAVGHDTYGQVGFVLTTDEAGRAVTLLGHPGFISMTLGVSPTPTNVSPVAKVITHAAWGWPGDWPLADDERELGYRLSTVPLKGRPSAVRLPRATGGGRAAFARRKGLLIRGTDASFCLCMRCGARWAPTFVLAKRSFVAPKGWWHCPNECNVGRHIPDYVRPSGDNYGWEKSVTGVDPVTPVTQPAAAESGADADALIGLIPAVVCSGEVLSFEVLV